LIIKKKKKKITNEKNTCNKIQQYLVQKQYLYKEKKREKIKKEFKHIYIQTESNHIECGEKSTRMTPSNLYFTLLMLSGGK